MNRILFDRASIFQKCFRCLFEGPFFCALKMWCRIKASRHQFWSQFLMFDKNGVAGPYFALWHDSDLLRTRTLSLHSWRVFFFWLNHLWRVGCGSWVINWISFVLLYVSVWILCKRSRGDQKEEEEIRFPCLQFQAPTRN